MVSRRNSRALVAEAARGEFATYGFAGARIARIAERAGVNKQLIFYYFGSKAGVYTEVVGQAKEELLTRLHAAEGASPGDRLRVMLDALLGWFAGNPDLAHLLCGAPERSSGDRGAREALLQVRDRISAVVSEGQGLGYFRDQLDPGLFAEQALALAIGAAALTGAQDSAPPDFVRRGEWKRAATAGLLRSVAW